MAGVLIHGLGFQESISHDALRAGVPRSSMGSGDHFAEDAFHFGDDGGPAEGVGGLAGGVAEAGAQGGIEQGFGG